MSRVIGRNGTEVAYAPADGRSDFTPALVSSDAPEDVDTLIAQLREAARHAGVQRDDPMMPLLTALAHQIRFLAARTAKSDRVATEASARIREALQQSRQSADAEISRFQKGIAQAEAVTIRQIADSIAETAERALTKRVAIFQWKLIFQVAIVIALIAASALGGGYWWGRDTTLSTVHETETGLQVAFESGAGAAQKWLTLMQ